MKKQAATGGRSDRSTGRRIMPGPVGLRSLPAVHSILDLPETAPLLDQWGRDRVVAAIRAALTNARAALRQARPPAEPPPAPGVLLDGVRRILAAQESPRLRRVVNASGVILHTGLGRAFMPESVAESLASASGYCNLQMDLETGARSHREEAIRELVTELTGAQDCVLVNNNAGATLLVLRALAKGREVVISRGELIEIGGEFRLPDVMAESGAILREVGATNKTHLKDYEKALGPETGLIMKAHKSNYAIVGFTHDVGIGEIAAIGHRRKIPVVDDLGCGALVSLERFGMEHEMTVRESLEAGADLALFSTDKLIGGPQGGLIVGRKDLIARIRSCPLYRTLRVCKLTLAALEPTLRLFRSVDTLGRTHPVYRMISRPVAELEAQARKLAGEIAMRQPAWTVRVSAETSFLGGGALPTAELPSWAVALVAPGLPADALARAFRRAPIPVVTRVKSRIVFLDMRTVFERDLADILEACRRLECAVS